MRITIIIERGLREDALLVLESVGFVREGPDEVTDSAERLAVTGELPEKSLPELQAIGGVLDWTVPPLEEAPEGVSKTWPWNQNPETD